MAEKLAAVSGPLAFPCRVNVSRDHEVGGAAISQVVGVGTYDIAPGDYVPVRVRRAIGGLQVVRGDVAREKGYLPRGRWQKPAKAWQVTSDDIAFRRSLGTSGEPIEIPNLFRIRHIQRGQTHGTVCL